MGERMTSSVDLEAAVEEEDSVEEEVATEAMEVATTTARDMAVAMEAMTTARDMAVAMTTAKDMAVATTTARDMETKVDMEVVANKEVVMASKRQAVGEGLVLVLLLQGAIIPTAVSKLQFAGGRRSGYRR